MSLGPAGAGGGGMTYAPPEQSEPAITSSRPWAIVANSGIPESAPEMSKNTFTCWVSMSCEVLQRTSQSRWVRGEKEGPGGQDRYLESGRQTIT